MPDTATLEVTLTEDTAGKLAEIAAREDSTPNAMAARAVAGFVAREAAIIAAIEQGQAEIRAGLGIPQEQVVQHARAYLDTAHAKW